MSLKMNEWKNPRTLNPRRIDVVGCGNAIRKEGREEGKRKRIDVGYSNAGDKEEEEEEGVVGWSFTHIMGVA
jgi:hypothetical protein